MFRISAEPIRPGRLREFLEDPGAGGVVVFEGRVRCRNEGRDVVGLEYEAFEELAANEAAKIFAEARAKFPLLQIACVHRSGSLEVGELAVWLGVACVHRREAFAACELIIDQIKHRLPIWKKERYADGESAWVGCSHVGVGEKVL